MAQPANKRLLTEAAVAAAGPLKSALDAKANASDVPEMARDALGSALVAGSNVTITPNDAGDTITIAAAGGTAGETVQRLASATSAITLTKADLTHFLTLTGNVTITAPAADAGSVAHTVVLDQDASGGRAVTWGSNIAWAGGSAPALSTVPGTRSIVTLLTMDSGATYVGILAATGIVPATVTTVTAPSAVTGLSVTAGASSLDLSWAAPTNGGSPITNYKIYRRSSGSQTLLATVGTVLTYSDATATPGTTYYYQVAAVNSAGEGPKSTEQSGAISLGPTLIVADNFNRADTPTGNAGNSPGTTPTGALQWQGSEIHNFGVISNGLGSVGGTDLNAYVASGKANVAVEVVVRTKVAYDALVLRRTDDNNLFRIGWTSSGIIVYRRQGGSYTVIHEGPAGGGVPEGSTFRVEANGSSWNIKVNGTSIYTLTDAFQSTATQHGIWSATSNVAARWDDFKVYEL